MSSSIRSNGETTLIRTPDDDQERKKSKSICTFNCCTVLLLALITVLMQLLLLMNISNNSSNNESSNSYLSISANKRSNWIMGDQPLQVTSVPVEEDNNYRWQQQQQHQKYCFDKVSTTIDVDNLLSLGKLLLRQGDAIGALASCTSVFAVGSLPSAEGREEDRRTYHTNDKDLLIQAYVCAGEASLKLYQDIRSILHDNSQLSSTATSSSSATEANRIEQAKTYFELAMDLDPRNPRVRAGLALSLFLIATTVTATPITATDSTNNNKAHRSLLLLDAIQHFTTAANYYDQSIAKEAIDDEATTASMQRECWYHAALCFIHLQHYSDAIPLLRRSLVGINTHPKGTDASYTTNIDDILSVITKIEGLKCELEAQSVKLEKLLHRTTVTLPSTDFTVLPAHNAPIDVNAGDTLGSRISRPKPGEMDLTTKTIHEEDIARVSESDRGQIHPSNHDGRIDEINNNFSLVSSTTNIDFSPQSDKMMDNHLLIEDAADETMFTLNTRQDVELLVTSDEDLSLTEVVVVDTVASHKVIEMQQPTLVSENTVLKTVAMTDASSSSSSLLSTNESEQNDNEGASTAGVNPDLVINVKVESLPNYDEDTASNPVVHGDMTASGSTEYQENQRNIVSAVVEDDHITIGSASKTEEVSIEQHMINLNSSFSAIPSSQGEIHMDSVIDEHANIITPSDDIGLLLISEVEMDINTSSHGDSAANAFDTKVEEVDIANDNVVKRDKLNETTSLLPSAENLHDAGPQDTDEMKTEEDPNATILSSDLSGAIDAKSDGEDPTVEASTEPRQQQLFSNSTVSGNASVILNEDSALPAVSDDLFADMVAPNTSNPKAEPNDKPEFKLDLESEIEIPDLYSATPRLSEEVNLTPLEESYMKVADSLLSKSNFLRASKQLQKVIKSSPNYLPARLGYANALESLAGDKKKNVKEITLAYVEAAKVALKQDARVDYMSSAAGDGGLAEAFLHHALLFAKSAPKKDRLELFHSLISAAHTGSFAADVYYHLGMELLPTERDQSSTTIDYSLATHAFRTANQYASLITGNEGKGHGKSLVQLAKIGLLVSADKMQVQMILQRALACTLDDVTESEALLLLEQTKSATDGVASGPIQGEYRKDERSDAFLQSSIPDKDFTMTKLKSGLKAPDLGRMWVRGLEKAEKDE